MSFWDLLNGIFKSPKMCILRVRAEINKRSFEPFCVGVYKDDKRAGTNANDDARGKRPTGTNAYSNSSSADRYRDSTTSKSSNVYGDGDGRFLDVIRSVILSEASQNETKGVSPASACRVEAGVPKVSKHGA